MKPGQTTQVRLGGKGRPVIGRVVLDGTPPEPVDWPTQYPAMPDQTGGQEVPLQVARNRSGDQRRSAP